MEQISNPEKDKKFEYASISEQLKNIERWNEQYDLGIPLDTSVSESLETNSDLEHYVVITPNLGSTEQTFSALWNIIKDQYDGVSEESFPADTKPGRYLTLAIDEKLPKSLNVSGKGFVNHISTFAYYGEPVINRPQHALTASELDLSAYYSPTEYGAPRTKTPAPYLIRTPENAPGVEVLAFLAHNPDYVKRMLPSHEEHVPWLWIPGVQFHDSEGNVTARTPLANVSVNGVLKISPVWNDGGNQNAAIPQFTRTPEQV